MSDTYFELSGDDVSQELLPVIRSHVSHLLINLIVEVCGGIKAQSEGHLNLTHQYIGYSSRGCHRYKLELSTKSS